MPTTSWGHSECFEAGPAILSSPKKKLWHNFLQIFYKFITPIRNLLHFHIKKYKEFAQLQIEPSSATRNFLPKEAFDLHSSPEFIKNLLQRIHNI